MSNPLLITDTNLSRAWARGFLAVTEPGAKKIVPMVVTIHNIADSLPIEYAPIRQSLDTVLAQQGQASCSTVANTIFPRSMWNPDVPRAHLFARYERALPHIKRADGANKYGTYFERMIAFGKHPTIQPEGINQLKHIIDTYGRMNRRPTALQVGILDPAKDHTDQRQRGFPCLQQVAFTPDTKQGTLTVTGYYAHQHLFQKAYGNYLGLYHLGLFMAHELGLGLTSVVCVASVASRGEKQTTLAALRENVRLLYDAMRDDQPLYIQEQMYANASSGTTLRF